ncbi:general odorant-binding protein 72 [Manduca sexta]|uniref:general odorant-binding protein 72 n=1 Tax=Manduca sexta TaxID=7130 RepID=UPI00188F2941|nr:general odorant-binding protein 72 [Manduca sexta]
MLFLVVAKFFILLSLGEAMTMKQIRNTGKMMRKQCQPKNNVEDEKIDPLGKGVFINEKEVKCYMACIMKMANTIKNGKINYEAAMKQADLLLPEDIKELAKEALTSCRKVADSHKDVCDAAFYISKCIYEYNPDIFYFP